jgi:hypothetical protein
MNKKSWVLNEPLKIVKSVDEPYLQNASGTLGAHQLEVHHAPGPETPAEFRVFLDGKLIFELGMTTPELAWYQVCQELGYRAEEHWDLDPALILFQQALPALARGWREHGLPFNDLGIPDGVICLANVRAAWEKETKAPTPTPDDEVETLVAACFAALPLRAVVFHDDPRRRKDFLGTALDDPLLGVFLQFGRSRANRATLAKGTINATGGLGWSPWELGGAWHEGGREFGATQGPADFLKAAGLEDSVLPGWPEAFRKRLDSLVKFMDPVVEEYRVGYPAGIPWHREERTRFLDHMIVAVRTTGGRHILTLDDGSELVVVEAEHAALTQVAGQEDQ